MECLVVSFDFVPLSNGFISFVARTLQLCQLCFECCRPCEKYCDSRVSLFDHPQQLWHGVDNWRNDLRQVVTLVSNLSHVFLV